MKKITLYISIIVLLACANACTQTEAGKTSENKAQHAKKEEHDHEEAGIHLTQTQAKTIGLEFGSFVKMKINDFITATGTLGLPPNAYSSVSAKASGFIRGNQTYVEGSYVKQGAVMAYLENPEFILKQQAYLEVKAELTFLRQELARQQALVSANAGVKKTVQKLKSELAIKNAQLKGKAKYLNYLGIGVQSLTTDNIQQQIAIVAPMSGYLTSVNMHNGVYVEPARELMEIVDESHLHIELEVFEKDIALLKKGQKISYIVPALGAKQYSAEVFMIGKEFNKANKTVRIHGHLEGAHPQFIKDLFVTAKVWLNDQSVTALPDKAVIKDGTTSFIFVGKQHEKDELEFAQIKVVAGASDNGFTSVKLIDKIPKGMRIVTKGAYYVYAQSKAGELEHEH